MYYVIRIVYSPSSILLMEWYRSFYCQHFSVADIRVLKVWAFLGTGTYINLDQVIFRPRLNMGSRLNTVISVDTGEVSSD